MSRLMTGLQVFLAVVFLTVVSCGPAKRKECTNRADECTTGMETARMTADLERICREIRSSIDCMNKLMDDCLGLRIPLINTVLEDMEEFSRSNCKTRVDKNVNDEIGNDEETKEIEKCFQKYKDYMYDCMFDPYQDIMSEISENEDLDEDIIMCAIYRRNTGCFVDRFREKCDNITDMIAEKKLPDPPEEFVEACRTAEEY